MPAPCPVPLPSSRLLPLGRATENPNQDHPGPVTVVSGLLHQGHLSTISPGQDGWASGRDPLRDSGQHLWGQLTLGRGQGLSWGLLL